MTTGVSMMSTQPSYDEQIVPTLRKRLEYEAAYLSNRLSNYSDLNSPASTTTFGHKAFPPSPPTPLGDFSHPPVPSSGETTKSSPDPNHAFGTSHLTPASPTNIPVPTRVRTKSTPLSGHMFNTRTSPMLSQGPNASAGPSRRQSRTPQPSDSTMRSPTMPSPVAEAYTSTSPLQPSRIPTRPRSKSQLNTARPKPPLNQSAPPPLPNTQGSRIAPPMTRRGSSPTKNSYLDGRRLSRSESPDLGNGTRINEGLIRNELPPFKLFPNEAMRIAEKGYDMANSYNYDSGYTIADDSAQDQRGGIGAPNFGLSSSLGSRPDLVQSGSLSRSATTAVGLGLPSSSSFMRKAAISGSGSKQRSVTTKVATTDKSFINGSTTRSASLNMLAASQSTRLGVAAHFVPPEQTYTPPKGANWDDVVIPTVAKQLGLGGSIGEKRQGDEGDLAVEWDKDGTPVKWVKRNNHRLDVSQGSHNSGLSANDFMANSSAGESFATPTHSAFSPTFEVSPNNPLLKRSESTSTSIPQVGGLKPKRSGESLDRNGQAGMPRTTQSQSTSLTVDPYAHASSASAYPPPSPTPFSNLQPVPSGWKSHHHRASLGRNPDSSSSQQYAQDQGQGQMEGRIRNPSFGGSGQSSPTRRPSVLRKPTNQTSQMSLRSLAAAQLRANNEGSTPAFHPSTGDLRAFARGQTHAPSALSTPTKGGPMDNFDNTRNASMSDRMASSSAANNGWLPDTPVSKKGGQKAKEGEHGKGCGCVIM